MDEKICKIEMQILLIKTIHPNPRSDRFIGAVLFSNISLLNFYCSVDCLNGDLEGLDGFYGVSIQSSYSILNFQSDDVDCFNIKLISLNTFIN